MLIVFAITELTVTWFFFAHFTHKFLRSTFIGRFHMAVRKSTQGQQVTEVPYMLVLHGPTVAVNLTIPKMFRYFSFCVRCVSDCFAVDI